MSKHKIIYITGFMGSGKTTAGKKLASALKWSFIDLDAEIEKLLGKKIKQVFSESGEASFRKTESEVLQNLDIQNNTVISVGGGAPCFSDNMDFMNSRGVVIYLKMTPGQLSSRLSENREQRPLLNGIDEKDFPEYIKSKLTEREKYYNKASIIIDGMDLDIKSLVNIINEKSGCF